eukprot:768422-Hanusia_phi.AAC.3
MSLIANGYAGHCRGVSRGPERRRRQRKEDMSNSLEEDETKQIVCCSQLIFLFVKQQLLLIANVTSSPHVKFRSVRHRHGLLLTLEHVLSHAGVSESSQDRRRSSVYSVDSTVWQDDVVPLYRHNEHFPGYTGHVPKLNQTHGTRFSQASRMALQTPPSLDRYEPSCTCAGLT